MRPLAPMLPPYFDEEGWRLLPELPTPRIEGSEAKGNILWVTRAVVLHKGQRVCCPVVDALEGGVERRYRLPPELLGWAGAVVEAQLLHGAPLLPALVEFGRLRGRTYAEFLDDDGRRRT
jgi:hypothetical protein